MAFKKRRMMFIPRVNPKSFVFFFEKGNSGASWSIRDYSIKHRLRQYGPHEFPWSADEIHEMAEHSLDAPTVSTDNLTFWYEHTCECNKRHLGATSASNPSPPVGTASTSPTRTPPPTTDPPNGSFPVLNLQQLLDAPKGRKGQDMERLLHSPNSEDWVTWNFFQVLFKQYPSGWWGHFISAARRRNPNLRFPFDDRSLPLPTLWSSVTAPAEYEAQSRIRMQSSGNAEAVLRARNPEPVENPSEIDVSFKHDHFLVYVEAKLGSDISMNTKYDPQRNQIVRNIDCLIGNAGERMPIFWLLVRDQEPDRAYVQLMNSYKADPSALATELPHRDRAKLNVVAQNLTILLWSDFTGLRAGVGRREHRRKAGIGAQNSHCRIDGERGESRWTDSISTESSRRLQRWLIPTRS